MLLVANITVNKYRKRRFKVKWDVNIDSNLSEFLCQHEEYVALTDFIKIVCFHIATNPGLMISLNKQQGRFSCCCNLIWSKSKVFLHMQHWKLFVCRGWSEKIVELESDSTMSQSWIEFWNWILNSNLKQFVLVI